METQDYLMFAEIKRVERSQTETVGIFLFNRQLMGFSLELPWSNNQRQISCIPAGEYLCTRIKSPKFGDVFQVSNVPGRDGILIHAGNTTADSTGCILPGLSVGYLKESRAVLQSKAFLSSFYQKLTGIKFFTLNISELAL